MYEVYTTATELFARTVQWDTKVDGASALALELWGYRVKAAQLFFALRRGRARSFGAAWGRSPIVCPASR